MREFSTHPNYLRIRNCLLLLVNLFFDKEHPDHYHTKGNSSKNLSKHDRLQFEKLIRKEVMENN